MAESSSTQPPAPSVGALAELYLGNILYALELAALSLQGQGKAEDAAFYRGIGRTLADAHGKAKTSAREGGSAHADARGS